MHIRRADVFFGLTLLIKGRMPQWQLWIVAKQVPIGLLTGKALAKFRSEFRPRPLTRLGHLPRPGRMLRSKPQLRGFLSIIEPPAQPKSLSAQDARAQLVLVENDVSIATRSVE